MSVAIHLGCLIAVACLTPPELPPTPRADIDFTRIDVPPLDPLTTLGDAGPTTLEVPRADATSEAAGGRAAGAAGAAAEVAQAAPKPIAAPFGTVAALGGLFGDARLLGRLGDVVGPIEESDEPGEGGAGGRGTGSGGGVGPGAGGGFFGAKPAGLSVVYVVDGSRSMNHPHPSESKTRFRRLKLELAQSILAMPPEMEFFVIFFNDDAIPMPAPHPISATESNKRQFLPWIAQAKADRETDPRRALAMALRMRPNVIYFLTDGSFDRPIERELLRLSQRHTVIHTFAFGTDAGRDALRAIAKANGGKFHFVP